MSQSSGTGPEKGGAEDGLDARIRQARARLDGAETAAENAARASGIGFAMRLGTELVAALVVGLAIGYWLDRWLGSGPWFLLLFFFIGAAAGILNVWRTASGQDAAVGYRPAATARKRGDAPGKDA